MKAFNHALLVGGGATALLGGVATAELGLAPIRQALTAETAPSLDTMDPDAPKPIQADLASNDQVAPPAVIVPVRVAARPARHSGDIVDDRPPGADVEGRQADVGDTREVVAGNPSLEFDPARAARPEVRDAEQDRDPSTAAQDSPSDDPPPATPG